MWRKPYFEHVPNFSRSYTAAWKCQAGNGIHNLGTHGKVSGLEV